MKMDENEDMDVIDQDDINEEIEQNEQPSFPSLTPTQMNVKNKKNFSPLIQTIEKNIKKNFLIPSIKNK